MQAVDGPAFAIGDKVVHPAHGAGVVADIVRREFLVDYHRYYLIELAAMDMKLMVPVRNAANIGLRKIMDDNAVKSAFGILESTPEVLPDHFNKRRTMIEDSLRSGRVLTVAEVIRNLHWRNLARKLSSTETDLLAKAKAMLAGEVALVWNMDVSKVLEHMDQILENSSNGHQDG